MILKNSEEYDSILHVGADLDFIDRFFTANIKDLDTAKKVNAEDIVKEQKMSDGPDTTDGEIKR